MTVDVSDVHQTFEYRTDAAVARSLPVGLVLWFLGLLLFVLMKGERASAEDVLVGAGLVVAGIGLSVFALRRRSSRGRPVFALSPNGIYFRRVAEFLLPWPEVKGVDTADITTWDWYKATDIIHWSWSKLRLPTVTYRGVTVVLVSKEFYESHIFIDSLLRRGPDWGALFVPKGPLVQIALYQVLTSIEPQVLRAAIEARWHAFRGEPAGSAPQDAKSAGRSRASVPSVVGTWMKTLGASRAAASPRPTTGIVAAGDNPKTISAWEAVQIVAPLIGIAVLLAKLLGIW